MSEPWFAPKPKGFGLQPRNAKGWLAVLLFIAVVGGTIVACKYTLEPALMGPVVLVLSLLETAGFIALAYAKSK